MKEIGALRKEEQFLWKLQALWDDPASTPTLLPFDEPDVICALPEDTVRRAVKGLYGKRFEDVPLAVDFRGGGPGVTVRR